MQTSYIDQLKEHRTILDAMLRSQQNHVPAGVGLQAIHKIYVTILEDAIRVLNSMIDYLSPRNET